MLAQAVRAANERRLKALLPAMAGVAVFGIVYGAFWVLPLPADYRSRIHPLYFLSYLHDRGGLLGFALDAAWLFVPALVVSSRLERPDSRSVSLLAFALAPFLIVNAVEAVGVLPIPNVDENWVQIMLPVPLLVRAFAVGLAGARWTRLGHRARVLFATTAALIVVPPAVVSTRYARLLQTHPEQGHEYSTTTRWPKPWRPFRSRTASSSRTTCGIRPRDFDETIGRCRSPRSSATRRSP